MNIESRDNAIRRVTSLDGLRGVAAILVVLYHYLYRWNDRLDVDFGWVSIWAQFGWLGVYIFFMISGFVIHNSLERAPSMPRFLQNRWWRLFPAMFLATAYISFGYSWFSIWPAGEISLVDVIPGLLFIDPQALSYMLGSSVDSIDGVFWTIYIEVKFYVVIALLYFRFKDHSAVGICLIYLLYLAATALESTFDFLVVFRNVLSWIGAPYFIWFYLGIVFKKILAQPDDLTLRVLFISLSILAAAHLSHLSTVLFLLSLAVQGVFVSAFVFKPAIAVLNNRALQFIGFLSYPLYLIHQNFGVALIASLISVKVSPPAATFAAIFVSMVFAWLITKGERFFVLVRGKTYQADNAKFERR